MVVLVHEKTQGPVVAPPAFMLDSIKQFIESHNISLISNGSTCRSLDIQAIYLSLDVVYGATRTDVYSQHSILGLVECPFQYRRTIRLVGRFPFSLDYDIG